MANLTVRSDLKMTQIADLVYQQKTTKEIAQLMEMSTVQVNRYIEELRAEWREHRIHTAEDHFDEALARLARLEMHLMPAIEREYVPAFDRMLMLYDQRNRLLGLYAASKSEVDIGEQLTKLLTKISQEEDEPLALPEPQVSIEGEFKDVD